MLVSCSLAVGDASAGCFVLSSCKDGVLENWTVLDLFSRTKISGLGLGFELPWQLRGDGSFVTFLTAANPQRKSRYSTTRIIKQYPNGKTWRDH